MTQGSRVLYVDRGDARADVARALEDRGFDVRTVDRKAGALERVAWADCVVAEYDLPGGDGLELLEGVRQRAPDCPFVLFTGAGSEAVASEAIGAGVTDYVPKDADEPVARLADGIERATRATTGGTGGRGRDDRLLDQLGLPVYVTDADGVITAFNDRAAEVTGHDPEAVIGERLSEVLSPQEPERAEGIARGPLAAGGDGTTSYDLTVRTANGATLEVENHVSRLTHDGDPLGTVGVLVRTGGQPDGRLRRLHDATRELMAETDPERVAELTTEAAREVIDVAGAAVYLASEDGLGPVAATEGHGDAAGEPPAVVESVYRSGDPRVEVADQSADDDGRGYFPLGDHGVVAVAASDAGGFTAAEIQLATILAANAEAALDRAANEAALRRERDDLAALFEHIPDPTVETTMQDGEPIVERVNPAFEETFGYDSEELRGESVDDYIVPEGYGTEATTYNDRVESGDGFQGEVRRRTADGLRDFILHVVAHDVGETETRGYAIYTDITEQKGRQRELERQNRRIEALHDVTKRMNSASGRTAIYDLVIDAAEEILEFDLSLVDEVEGDVLVPKAVSSGVSLDDYYEETPLDRADNLAAEAARTGETSVVDDLRASRYAPANFEYRSALSVPLGDRGVFQAVAKEEAAFSAADCQLAELLAEHAVAAINRQARERELEARAEELARQNERLDRFASVVSHDLQNPLSVARGRLDLAWSTRDEDHYRAVQRAHERMEELVNGLLTLARQGELRSDPVPVSLRNAATEAWRCVETDGLELVIEDATTVEADPERLQQLLENLFTNTIEHAGDATAVTVGGLEDGFYAEDDGVGIPEADREDILESGRSGTEAGTGLGLAIVDTVAEAHGWRVTVTSSADGGARFEFREAPDATADERSP